MQEKNLFVLECERVKKQEYRRNKRKLDEMHECTDLEETHNKRKKKLDDHERTSYQSHFKDIKECIKQFIQVKLHDHCLYVLAAIKRGLEKVFAC